MPVIDTVLTLSTPFPDDFVVVCCFSYEPGTVCCCVVVFLVVVLVSIEVLEDTASQSVIVSPSSRDIYSAVLFT
jgi:hypothetical protein